MSVDQPEEVIETPTPEGLASINGARVTASTRRRLRVYCFVTEKNTNDVLEEALVTFLDAHRVVVSVDGEVQG